MGLVGLTIIVLLTSFNGIIEEHQIGHAFEEALPFTALLVVFFSIVAVIHDQHLFTPLIDYVLAFEGDARTSAFFVANGLLSMISDNVFVATVYINEVFAALEAGDITRREFDLLAVAINTGTNLPSVATPQWSSRVLVPAHLCFSATHQAVLRTHGYHGAAVHAGTVLAWACSRLSTCSRQTRFPAHARELARYLRQCSSGYVPWAASSSSLARITGNGARSPDKRRIPATASLPASVSLFPPRANVVCPPVMAR